MIVRSRTRSDFSQLKRRMLSEMFERILYLDEQLVRRHAVPFAACQLFPEGDAVLDIRSVTGPHEPPVGGDRRSNEIPQKLVQTHPGPDSGALSRGAQAPR